MRDRSGANNSNWRGGRRRGGQGQRYWLVYAPGHPAAFQGAVLEHRLVVEAELSRYLGRDEVVHHRNGDSLDNRIENLEVMTQAEHARLHVEESLGLHRWVSPPAVRHEKTCEQCRAGFVAVGKKHERQRFCSRNCYWEYRRSTGGALAAGRAA